MNLTQWREGRKDAVIALLLPYCAVITVFYPVIPSKAGIRKVADAVRAPPRRYGALTLC